MTPHQVTSNVILPLADGDRLWRPWFPVTSTRPDIGVMVRGEGCHVWDRQGVRYLDAISSAMNAICGYGHPALLKAAHGQLVDLPHFDLSVGSNEPAEALAVKLAAIAPSGLSRTLFTNSGSEAVEAALRMVLDFWVNTGAPRRRIVTFARGYHGSTALTQHLSGLPFLRRDLDAALPVTRVELPMQAGELRTEAGRNALASAFRCAVLDHGDGGSDVAAIVVEPLINVGGGIVLPSGFLADLRGLADEVGALLVVDEVFTGLGRAGSMFAVERDRAVPDILVTSKGLGAGLMPLGAATAKEEIYRAFAEDTAFGGIRYGHTMSGNAVACAVGLAVIDVLMRESLVENGQRLGAAILLDLEAWRDSSLVVDVRGQGLFVAIELNNPPSADLLVKEARERGVLLRQQGSTVMVVPPLVISHEESDEIVRVVTASLQVLHARALVQN